MTIFAARDSYTVTFEFADGTSPDTITRKVLKGNHIFNSQTAQNDFFSPYNNRLNKTGCTFDGWYKVNAGNVLDTEKFDLLADEVNSDITLRARWTCTISFNPNKTGQSTSSKLTVFYGDTVPASALPADMRTLSADTKFKEWHIDRVNGEKFVFAGNTGATTITKSITLYAIWNTHTVTFNANGGNLNGVSATVTVDDGESITKPASTPTMNSGSYRRFKGWTLHQNQDDYYVFGTPVTEDFTLYARWGNVFNITFDANGGLFADGAVYKYADSSTNNPGRVYKTTVDGMEKPTREGFIFIGW